AVVEAEFLLGGCGGDEGGEEGEREAGADGHRRLRDRGGRPPRLVYDWRTKRKPHRRACSDTFTVTSWPNGPSSVMPNSRACSVNAPSILTPYSFGTTRTGIVTDLVTPWSVRSPVIRWVAAWSLAIGRSIVAV